MTTKPTAASSEPSPKQRPVKDTNPVRDLGATHDSSLHPAERLNDLAVIGEWLGCSVKTVRRLIDRGEIGYYQVGRLKRVSDEQYAEYLARARRGASVTRQQMK